MRVFAPSVNLTGGRASIEARVEIAGELRQWWIGVPGSHVGLLDLGATPFLPAAVVLACATGENLDICGPVSTRAFHCAHGAARHLSTQYGWSVPRITAPDACELAFVAGRGRGLLFTRDLDSSANLVASLRGDGPTLTHLLCVDSIEPRHSTTTRLQVWRDTELAAASVGLPLVRLTTNMRDEVEKFVAWDPAHSEVLFGAALALGPLLAEIVASPARGEWPGAYWETERTSAITMGASRTKVEKAMIVASEEHLLRRLKVCWEADIRGNCGRCLKCLATMTALVSANAVAGLATFEQPLNEGAIRRLRLDYRASWSITEGIIREACDGLGAGHGDIRDAWMDYIARLRSGPAAGLAGLNPAALIESVGGLFDPDVPIGWGPGAIPLRMPAAAAGALVDAQVGLERSLAWTFAERLSPAAAQVAGCLTESWGSGAVALVDPGVPGLPPDAIRRLLRASTVRCWFSASNYLSGVPFIESLEAGCVPLQVMPDDAAIELRDHLGPDTDAFVIGLSELEDGYPASDVLCSRWQAAVQLAIARSTQDEALVGLDH